MKKFAISIIIILSFATALMAAVPAIPPPWKTSGTTLEPVSSAITSVSIPGLLLSSNISINDDDLSVILDADNDGTAEDFYIKKNGAAGTTLFQVDKDGDAFITGDITVTGNNVICDAYQTDSNGLTISADDDGGGTGDITIKLSNAEVMDITAANGVDTKALTLLCGTNANLTDTPNAQMVVSEADTGYSNSGNAGIYGESVAVDTVRLGCGILGVGKSAGNQAGYGVNGIAKVTATGDTGSAIGGAFGSDDTHASGANMALYASATNGALNYSFYGGAGDIYNAGNGELTGHLSDVKSVTAHTSDASLTADQCKNHIHSNSGDADAEILTLPTVAAGLRATFVVETAQNFDINPNGSERIFGLTDSGGDAIRSNTVGDTITLIGTSNGWYVESYYAGGGWTDVD